MPPAPLITLLTDFGSSDHFVAAMKGVIAAICPEARIVDITHEIAPYAILEGAWTLAEAAPCFPPGTIHIAVVDPGVGTARRPIAISANGQFFIGPDNGLLALATSAGAPLHAVEITRTDLFRHPVSSTFHGRDIFAPVAASFARGLAFSTLGQPVDSWRQLPEAIPVPNPDGSWQGIIVKVDRFGNLITNLPASIPTPWCLEGPGFTIRACSTTYENAPEGEPVLIAGSARTIEIFINKGSAMSKLRVTAGAPVIVRQCK